MSKEQLERLLSGLEKLENEIKAIPGSAGNGQLIDATTHIKNSAEHLKRYFLLIGVGK